MNHDVRSARNKIRLLESHMKVLKDYLVSKYHVRDWHGVSDAANDLRECAAELRTLRRLIAPLKLVLQPREEE